MMMIARHLLLMDEKRPGQNEKRTIFIYHVFSKMCLTHFCCVIVSLLAKKVKEKKNKVNNPTSFIALPIMLVK
jgi:hypothetical protein